MLTLSHAPARVDHARHPRRGPRWQIAAQLSVLALWMERYNQRLTLSELDDHQLRDIGKSPEEVRRECSKWPWQA